MVGRKALSRRGSYIEMNSKTVSVTMTGPARPGIIAEVRGLGAAGKAQFLEESDG